MVLDKCSLCYHSNNQYAFILTKNIDYYVSVRTIPFVLLPLISLVVYVSLHYVPSTYYRACWIINTHEILDKCMI